MPERVVTDNGHETGAQPEPGSAARCDCARAADRKFRSLHDPLRLAELDVDVVALQHEVRVTVAQHDEVQYRHAEGDRP